MTTTDALFAVLATIIVSLVSYIFISFQSDTKSRFTHQDALIEEMVKSNTSLQELIKLHDYRISNLEKKPSSLTVNNNNA
jgi:hypothetical protein